MAVVELHGLEIFGYHGVNEREQTDGQPFHYDLELEVGDAGVSDRIEDAVDYREVAAAVRELSEARRFDLLEALASAVADMLLERFPQAESVVVRVRKTKLRLPVEWSAVTVRRSARRP
jgi:7,8-dihydroneopterin aldolase/epimerase/oxygenase